METQGELNQPASVAVLEPDGQTAPLPAPKRRRRRLFVVGSILVVVLLLLVTAALVANASLSDAYSAKRAVQDYFAAQAHRDVDDMRNNSTFLRGDGSFDILFGPTMLAGMMEVPENAAIRDVRIKGISDVDSNTKSVTVSMMWNGKPRTTTYQVRKDPGRVHWLFYPSWRILIPYTTINVVVPNQGGGISLDGISAPAGSSVSALQTITGYHRVSMAATSMLYGSTQTVEALDSAASVTFHTTLTNAAIKEAGDAIKAAFNNCDAGKYDDCLNHTYTAPNNGDIYYLTMPGYAEIDYANYRYTMVGDPSDGATFTVEQERDKVTATGSCAVTLTVNGSRHYSFKGTYKANLTWVGGTFSSEVIGDCEAQKG